MKKLIRYIAFFSVPFLVGVMLLFTFPIDKNFCYHFVKGECENKGTWIYNRIFENSKPIDLAFLGASHTSCAIMDGLIEKELNRKTMDEINVANFGYCRGGRDIQYVILKDIIRVKKIKTIVIEVMEDEPKKSHPIFPYLAESTDLFGSFILFNQNYFTNLFTGLVVRFEQIKGKVFNTKRTIFTDFPDFGYMSSGQIATKESIAENQKNWKKRLDNRKNKQLRQIEINYSKHYIEKMVKLAQEYNCEVIFLYLPESGSGLKKPLLFEYYQKMGEIIVIPDSILSDHNNWKDATHFNDTGARLVSEYLINQMCYLH